MYLGGKLVSADYMFNGYSHTKKDFIKQVSIAFSSGDPLPYLFSRSETASSLERRGNSCRTISGLLVTLEQKYPGLTPGLIQYRGSCKISFHSHRSLILKSHRGASLRYRRRPGECRSLSQSQRNWKQNWTPPMCPNSPSPALPLNSGSHS